MFETGLQEHAHEFLNVSEVDAAYDPTPDGDEESTIEVLTPFAEAGFAKISGRDVGWVSTYSNNPDYAHLPNSAEGASFSLNAAIVEKTIALGHYQPHFTESGHLIVGIRGAAIVGGENSALHRNNILLEELKPNHRTFRCVMAVFHQATGTVSAFTASTVPNRGGVASCANFLNGHNGSLANMLPTGTYELCVGTHFGKSTTVPTVLRLGTGTGPSSASRATTLRTRNDGIYGTMDLWDPCRPNDNVHPAFSANSAEFSSLGCLTVPGRYRNGKHEGLWAEFRKTAGFDGEQHLGVRYELLLTTGMELAAISATASNNLTDLRRLAHGSYGDTVKDFQTKIGVTADGEFGPDTKKRLTELEAQAAGGAATGIYSATTEILLNLGVFR